MKLEGYFSESDITAAAEALRSWKSTTYARASESYSEQVISLLLVTRVIDEFRGKLDRVVSIRAIEEDREAGWDD